MENIVLETGKKRAQVNPSGFGFGFSVNLSDQYGAYKIFVGGTVSELSLNVVGGDKGSFVQR